MKLWHALGLAVFLIVLAWIVQVERREQANAVPMAVDAREDSSRPEPSQAVVGLQEEHVSMKNQPARVSQPQALKPPPAKPDTAAQAQPQAGTRGGWERADGDNVQAMLKPTAQEREAEQRQRLEQIVSHLETSLHRESYDSSWAAQIEAGITEDFEAEDWKGHALAEANCRSSLCRIVVTHENLDAAGAFVVHMGALRAFANTEGFYQRITREDGPSATVVYMARQGHRLPAMPSTLDSKNTRNTQTRRR